MLTNFVSAVRCVCHLVLTIGYSEDRGADGVNSYRGTFIPELW